MTTLTFTTTDGDSYGRQYFQDVEISPATVADGTLVRRFDTLRYPGSGTQLVIDPTAVTFDVGPGTGDHPVAITGTGFMPGLTIGISGSGVTATDIALSPDANTVYATFVVSGGTSTTPRVVTITNPDGGDVILTGVFAFDDAVEGATGTLGVVGVIEPTGVVTLSATGTLVVDNSVHVAVPTSGTGTLAVTGSPEPTGAVVMAGGGTLGVTGVAGP